MRDGSTPTVMRWMAGAIVFFLIDAVQLLVLVPGRSGELFAWPIAPALSAYALAATYLAGAYFFIRVTMGAPWERVVAGFAPVTLFVWLLAAATLLHLDRFAPAACHLWHGPGLRRCWPACWSEACG
jgi:hypothetical protein